MPTRIDNWPYPRWLAHRGAGKLAPENTLAAFRVGAAHGYRMFECDVKLSADGVPFLLHDNTTQRTIHNLEHVGVESGTMASDLDWRELSQLDAGSWHSPEFVGEPLPSFENIARYCLQNNYFLNIELKPTPGQEHQTGEIVAKHAARLWQDAATPPLLSSFDIAALDAARAAAPQLPRGLLLDFLARGWLETAGSLDCVAIVCNYTLWNSVSVSQAKNAGFRTMSYTVNEAGAAQCLIELGTDAIITDRVDLFSPSS